MANQKTSAPDISSWHSMGRNVKAQVVDGILFLAVNVSQTQIKNSPATKPKIAPDGSTKPTGNVSVATTGGNQPLPGELSDIKLGLNLYTAAPAA